MKQTELVFLFFRYVGVVVNHYVMRHFVASADDWAYKERKYCVWQRADLEDRKRNRSSYMSFGSNCKE